MTDYNNKIELHLFLIWNAAYYKLEEIICDISKNFKILKKLEIQWNKDRFSENLTQFYGTKLLDNSFKEKHCGNGPFTIVIVEDHKVNYDYRLTSKGKKNVNVNMFDLKMKYRKMTGGGHKIHATNSNFETKHDLILLLGKTLEEIKVNDKNNSQCIHRDIEGIDGWKDLAHLFKIVNNTIKYVVLRNFESFTDNKIDGDIDLLTDNPNELQFIMKAKKIHKNKRRAAYLVKINNQDVFVDIRYLKDNYYDEKWQSEMIINRYLCKSGYYILDSYNYFYSLLYHSIIHKPHMSNNYDKRLKEMLLSLELDLIDVEKHNWQFILSKFLYEKNYLITIPKDFSVFFNYKFSSKYKKDINSEIIRVIRSTLIKIKKKINAYY